MLDLAVGVVTILAGIAMLLVGAFFGLTGLTADAAAESAMHQIYAALQLLIAAVLGVGGCVMIRLGTMTPNKPQGKADDSTDARVTRTKVSDAAESLEQIAADIAWLKETKAKDLARARARPAEKVGHLERPAAPKEITQHNPADPQSGD
jgi:hypothetical protein